MGGWVGRGGRRDGPQDGREGGRAERIGLGSGSGLGRAEWLYCIGGLLGVRHCGFVNTGSSSGMRR